MATPDTQAHQPHDTQHSPVVLHQMQKRAGDAQLRAADRITAFAGSMTFVYVHCGLFAFWIASGLFGADRYPFQFLTFIVSLEAIFLSTFVMIGQNRQAAFQQAKADHDFHQQDRELKTNTQLTREIRVLRLTILKTRMFPELRSTFLWGRCETTWERSGVRGGRPNRSRSRCRPVRRAGLPRRGVLRFRLNRLMPPQGVTSTF